MIKRITHHATFKGRVALEALKESRTISELAQEFKLHPTQIVKWKTQAIREIAQLFKDRRKKKPEPDVDIDALYAQLGKLQSQLEFLKKNRHGQLLKNGW